MDLLIGLGAVALLTRVGFALYGAGLVRAKNSANTGMRAVGDVCVTVLAFWAVGAAILFREGNHWYSININLLLGIRLEQASFLMPALFFQFVMLLTASAVLGGAMSERGRFLPLCVGSAVLAGLVFPLAGRWAWGGWLKHRGFIDLAGGSALHVSAAVFAAVAAYRIGPRTGKFNRDGSSAMIPGHNLPLACMGALLVLGGWVAYVAGASVVRIPLPGREAYVAAPAALNVLLAGSAAGFSAMVFSHLRYGKTDVVLTLIGLLGGVVSLSAGGMALPTWAAVVSGVVAGVIVPMAALAIDLRGRLDDPLGVIAIHGVGGAWGTLAAGIFIPVTVAHGRFQQIAIQLVGLAAIALLSALVSFVVFAILKATVGLRVSEADEYDGLDLAEHDIGAYPDFQQTMIKSYHLREV